MSNKILSKSKRFSFNHVDADIHLTTHAKSPVYAVENHEHYEHKNLPISYNTLRFNQNTENALVFSLYTDTDNPKTLSKEFKYNLIHFYVYLTLYLVVVQGFSILLYIENNLSRTHLQIQIAFISLLLTLSYTILFLIWKSYFILKIRECFMVLGWFLYVYFIITDERVLCKITGEVYTSNSIPLVIGLLTLPPMLRKVLFDYYYYVFITGTSSLLLYLSLQLSYSPLTKYTTLSEITLVAVFSILQVVDSHKTDLCIKNLYWRQQKETVFNKEINLNKSASSGINSDVEVTIDICDRINLKLREVCKVVIYKDIKKVLKDAVNDIEKVKWKVAHKPEIKVNIDQNIDEEDRAYLQQNFLEVKYCNTEVVLRTLSDINNSMIIHNSVYSLEEVENALAAFGKDWLFDIWSLYETTGKSISIVAKYLFSKWSFDQSFNIPPETSDKYFTSLEKVKNIQAYKFNPYHNSCHAADVLHTFLFFVMNSYIMPKLTPNESLGSIIAILGHDVSHPGLTNRFLINNKDDLAMQYNDISVLENMHSSVIFNLMKKPGCNLLGNLENESWVQIRNLIIGMVLATDMSKHFEFLGQFRARVIGLNDLEINDFHDKTLVLSMAIKCADLGHSAKTIELHKKWSYLVCDELFAQGDLEKERNQTVSMYCDRESTDIDKSQSGFLKNVCMPLYEVWGVYLNSETIEKNCIQQQKSNQKYWEDRGKFRKSTILVEPGFGPSGKEGLDRLSSK